MPVSSLPGPEGIGTIGPEARRFVDRLPAMGQGIWQVLPLGPTGFDGSPYQSPSAFAANPVLISLADLAAEGLLPRDSLRRLARLPRESVDYPAVIPARMRLVRRACNAFYADAGRRQRAEFAGFQHRNAHWLEDYALYSALKSYHGGRPWTRWPRELAARRDAPLRRARRNHRRAVRNAALAQFLFERQWRRLLRRAHERGVELLGDIPIFTAHDSADVWARRDLFDLLENGRPRVVAGVPPDYFSARGQRWGTPLYAWENHGREQYRWWAQRLSRQFELVDILRLDHFRGFEACWEIPAREKTAVNGRWAPAPGHELLETVREHLGPLRVVAENLGFITPAVENLRRRFGFPGMAVLQFILEGGVRRPQACAPDTVMYTGTHDNDTAVGWFSRRAPHRNLRRCFSGGKSGIHWEMISLAAGSRAIAAVFPMQDVLGLDSRARINTPGTASGNWQWRMSAAQWEGADAGRLSALARDNRRC